jgi:sugar lactone lactonase YvrE
VKTKLLILAAAAFSLTGLASQRGAPPELLACGSHDRLEVMCGLQSPEDLESTPDGRYLVVSQFVSGAGLALLAPETGEITPMSVSADRRDGWGEAACPGPMTAPFAPHGISIGTHPDGTPVLYAVNHGGRETVEMFALREAGDTWELVWHGCAVGSADYNDVAILPDGGYVATRPTGLGAGGNLFGGQPSGNVALWRPGLGETLLPETEAGYPNGVVADATGRFAYIAAWTGRQIRKYDLANQALVETIDLDFMPDNLTWTPEGGLIAAGIAGFGAAAGFGVAEVDPETMTATTLYEPPTEGLPSITGVSVALEHNGDLYIGAYQGDRIVRVEKETDGHP